ncbi:MAG: methylenetetrahydrofolate reductase [Deltaproteobacteria bacterium]|nr:methylenetetrahydrofolate reductase [Deltaproteobacteria bacterium]
MGFASDLNQDGFVLLTEVDPPKGIDLTKFTDSVTAIKGRVTAVAVTDGANAIMRMTHLAPCRMLIDNNIEPVMILNGRDRNRISFQGDMLAAWSLGVRTIIFKQGQDPAIGDQPMAESSGDLNIDVMLECAAALNNGHDLGGEKLDGKTDFLIGAHLEVSDDINVNRKNAGSVAKLAKAGIDFAVLGPTYDTNIVDLFAEATADAGIKLLSSIMLLKSVAMIRYLNNLPSVPNVPHEFLKQMMKSPVKQKAGMQIAASYINDIQDRCKGAVLLALGWGDQMPEFLDLLGR